MSTETPPYDPTVTWVRHCTSCGAMDDRERWASKVEAERDGAFQIPWRCPSCGGEGFEIKPVARLGGG
jgi:NAD-dependent SIR2 family protein deacetylase